MLKTKILSLVEYVLLQEILFRIIFHSSYPTKSTFSTVFISRPYSAFFLINTALFIFLLIDLLSDARDTYHLATIRRYLLILFSR